MAQEIELTGCRPEPLMNYLKALGIFRLVAEQKDPNATACWRQEHFVLCSDLSATALEDFFLKKYQPTPIATPWAGGSGFFKGDNRKALEAIATNKMDRLACYQKVIACAQRILQEEGMTEKPKGEAKERLLRRFRREMPDEFVRWMDAAIVLGQKEQDYAPVLGTGGNDGRLDFAQNFMQRIIDLLGLNPSGHKVTAALLKNCLFGTLTRGLSAAAVGQFAPGRVGGPNATQGMEGKSTDNPWDFVLMLEGTLLLAGALARRAGVLCSDKASFPFTVRCRTAGGIEIGHAEVTNARGELWLPVWNRFITLRELEHFFTEGRAEYSSRSARDSIDFARAVAQLGVDRGVEQFVRFCFLKRSGKAYLAVAADRFPVPQRPREAVGLLEEIDSWLNAFRDKTGDYFPVRFRTALSAVESAIFDYCRYSRREGLMAVFLALGQAEHELAVTAGRHGKQEVCPPLGNLSPRWIEATYDGTVEYNIALALSGIRAPSTEKDVPPIRANLEPVEWTSSKWRWRNAADPEVVWNSADLSANMTAVLERRKMDGARNRSVLSPLHSKRLASLQDVAIFLDPGRCDDSRIEQLLWSLVLVDHRSLLPSGLQRRALSEVNEEPPLLPRQFALLKLLFLPAPLVPIQDEPNRPPRWRMAGRDEPGLVIRSDPRIIRLLLADRVDQACQIAYERIRSSGLTPLPTAMSGRPARAREWERLPDSHVHGRRLAAALLIPVTDVAVDQMISLVVRSVEQPEELEATAIGGD
jgi:CRISPR-associated protein Csx17